MLTLRGVKISDKALGPEKPLPAPSIYNIEEGTITQNKKTVLQVPLKFATHNTVSLNTIKVEFQKAMVKQRWSLRSANDRKEMNETKEEAEQRERKSHTIFDEESNTLNFNKARPTDLPTNKNYNSPTSIEPD